jgi:hypothetical protein
MSHLAQLPRTIEQIDMDKYGCRDDWNNDMIRDGIIAVIKASEELDIDMWTYMNQYTPPTNQGFMFSDDAKINIIGQKMQIGHSGTSYGWTMRYLECLAKQGPPNRDVINRSWLSNEITTLKTCGICQEFTKSHIVTPCNHDYCKNCINNWLNQSNVCPLCRAKI